MDFELLNLRLMSHPMNWAFVWVTLALAALAYTAIHNAVASNAAAGSIAPD